MGSITQLNDKLRSVPQPLLSDDQAAIAIEELSAVDGEVDMLDLAARKGLLAISVPSDFGGADLANEVIAELIAAIARRSEPAALAAVSHFVAMELVRSSGTAEQRRGIYNRIQIGERLAHVGFGVPDALSAADGIGVRLEVAPHLVPAFRQDWTVLPTVDEQSKRGIAVVPTGSFVESGPVSGIHLAGDHVLALADDAEPIARAVEALLEAARRLGLLLPAGASDPDRAPSEQVMILGELLGAMVARVSSAIDGLQVGSATVDLSSLDRSVRALQELNRMARGV